GHDGGHPRRVGRGADATGEPPPQPVEEPLPQVLSVVLRVEELLSQQATTLLAGGLQGWWRDEHQAGRIPPRVRRSTSYASLRMRWSTYGSAETAATNGSTMGAEITVPTPVISR